MRTALKKASVAIGVVLAVSLALLLPGFLGDTTTELSTQGETRRTGAAPATQPTELAEPAIAVLLPTEVVPTATPLPTLAPATAVVPAAPALVLPTVTPTAIPIPTAQVAVVTPTPIAPPATAVPAVPTQAPTEVPTTDPVETASALVPESAEPTATVEPTVEPTATTEPTAEATAEPTIEPTTEPTVEPTATVEPTVEPTPTTEPTAEATAEPTAEPTVTTTPEPTATATPEPTAEATGTVAAWMWVESTDGLFLREAPGGQIVTVLNYRDQVHITGEVVLLGERLWALVDIPQPGWLAIEFLTDTEPVAINPDPGPTQPTDPPTDAEWAAFRNCESGGRYDVVDPSGLYHGAYQFLPSTWDGLASQFWPELVGVLPSQASAVDQDKMARKLFELEGTRPWPTCGVHLR